MVPKIMVLAAARPTYDYRRITAILNRQLRLPGRTPAPERVFREPRPYAAVPSNQSQNAA